ncbi:MAG: type VI secretion system tip protein VgrG [Rhodospirillales bacterium]|nr:type VI secretion system tip protein VgrG [Rhodospirillales bacterium]
MIAFESNIGWDAKLVPVRVRITEALSRCYEITLDVLAEAGTLDLSQAVNRRGSVRLQVGGAERVLHGVIRSTSAMGSLPRNLFWYRLVLVPRLALLELSMRSRVFCTERPARVAEVIAEVLNTAEGVQITAADHRANLHATTYPLRDMVVQYQESDLAFLSRLAEDAGIFYLFEQGENAERIVFGDSNLVFPPLAGGTAGEVLAFRPGVGIADAGPALRSLRREAHLVAAGAALNERFYASPATVLAVQSAAVTGGVGQRIWHEQDGYAESGWGQSLAEIRAQEAAIGQRVLYGESDCLGLAAGSLFAVRGDGAGRGDGRHVVTEIVHEIWESALGIDDLPGPGPRGQGYRNEFSAIPQDVPFRPARRTPRPVIAGMIRATIDGADDARSNVDDMGCYRIVFSFDTASRPPGRSSCPVRLITPYGGPAEGFHFPLRARTQVMVAFHNGDPDRPVILGPLYDADQKSVVSHANRSANTISTVSGITVKLNDGLPSGG